MYATFYCNRFRDYVKSESESGVFVLYVYRLTSPTTWVNTMEKNMLSISKIFI